MWHRVQAFSCLLKLPEGMLSRMERRAMSDFMLISELCRCRVAGSLEHLAAVVAA